MDEKPLPLANRAPQVPSPGGVVHYTLTETDAQIINRRREGSSGLLVGNTARAGQTFPADMVAVWGGGEYVNLQVRLDGNDTHWATSVGEGEPGERGRWIWPPRS